MPTLLLLDASGFLYRAFHAMPNLTGPGGQPTGALYGMLAMIRRLRKEQTADYFACVFDAPGKTFRDDLYPAYKAQRPPMPDAMRAQIEPIHEAIRLLGLPLLEVPAVEADDVIGTLARRAYAENIASIIVSADKDLAQLVVDPLAEKPGIRLLNPKEKGVNEWLDEAGVRARFGVPPTRIVDYLTLVGDSVDNVPGVEKCGPKTAVKWLNEYGSLDALIAQAEQVGGAVGAHLRAALPRLPLGRQLVTLHHEVDLSAVLPSGWSDLIPRAPDPVALAAFYQQQGLRAFLRERLPDGTTLLGEAARSGEGETTTAARHGRLSPASPEGAPLEVDIRELDRTRYETILRPEQLANWLQRLCRAPLVALDTETDSLDPMRAQLVGISFAVALPDPTAASPDDRIMADSDHPVINAAYLPLAHRYPGAPQQLDLAGALEQLRPWLEDPAAPKLLQNGKYDQHVFANHGIALAGQREDTLLQSYVLDSGERHNMDALAARHLHIRTLLFEEVAGKGAKQIGFDAVEINTATRYAAEDAEVTLRLHDCFAPRLAAEPRLHWIYHTLEMPVRTILFTMERHGVLLDAARLHAQSHALGLRLCELEEEIHALAGQPFNLGSTKQVAEILFGRMKLPVRKKTPKGAPSTDEEVLENLALDHPLPKKLLEHRAIAKLKSTYTDKLPRMIHPQTGRVHTHYAQAVAVTGRLSSNEPNLQNIPIRTAEGRRIREAFIAPPGCQIVSADYSQIELRIMAHLSEDPGLLAAFAQGMDIHRATAAEVFGLTPDAVSNEQRRYAKAINFGLIYGMSAFGLATQLGIERSAAQTYIDRYFARYPGVAAYMQRTREQARAQGYVETWFGRKLWLPEIRSSQPARRAGAERAAINAPMQGTAADLVKLAMIAVQNWLEGKAPPCPVDRLSANQATAQAVSRAANQATGQGDTCFSLSPTALLPAHARASRLLMQVHDELVLEVPAAELDTVRSTLPHLMCEVARLRVPLEVSVGVGESWEAAHG